MQLLKQFYAEIAANRSPAKLDLPHSHEYTIAVALSERLGRTVTWHEVREALSKEGVHLSEEY